MPSVPRLTSNQVAAAPLQIAARQVTPNGLQALGAGIQDAAGVLYEVKQRESLLADQTAVTEADRLLGQAENSLLYDPQSGAFAKQGKDALGIGAAALTQYDQNASKIEQGLSSERAKRVFREAAGKRRLDVERDLARHEGQQREIYADNEAKAYVQESINSAANHWDDPARTADELERQRAVIDQQASRKGWSATEREAALRGAQADTHTAILSRMMGARQTNRAAKYLDQVRGRLDSDTVLKAEKAIEAARIEDQANRIIAVYAQDGPDAGSALLAQLSKSGLRQDQLVDIYSKVQTGTAQIRAERQQRYAADLATVYEAIATDSAGETTSTQVDALWRQGALSPVEHASLQGRVEGSRIQGAAAAAAALEIRTALESGLPLDPTNTEQRKALSAAFAQDISKLKPGSQPWLQAASAYAARTRVLPTQASAWVRSSLRSPNPAVAAPAAQFVAAIEATASDAASSFDTDTKSMAGIINQMIGAGTPPDKAVELARETVFNRKPAITEQRKTEYRKVTDSDGALDSFIDRDFDTLFTFQPAATAGLKVDFRSQAEQYYLNTGDLNLARELAWTDLKKVYGISEVNGVKQMIAFPPERYGLTPKDIRADVDGFLKENPQPDGSTAEEVILVPDALTLQAVDSLMSGQSVRPSYKLITKSGDLVVDSQGIPKRYTIPSGEEMESRLRAAQQAAAEAARKQIEEARAAREAARRRQVEGPLKYR